MLRQEVRVVGRGVQAAVIDVAVIGVVAERELEVGRQRRGRDRAEAQLERAARLATVRSLRVDKQIPREVGELRDTRFGDD